MTCLWSFSVPSESELRSLYIDTLEEGIYYATLSLMREDQEETLDCRPSDGIALALRYGADIVIDPRVVEGSSVKKSDLPELVDLNSYFFG